MRGTFRMVAVGMLLAAACTRSEPAATPTGSAGGAYNPTIDPARFTGPIDNPYFPLEPGTRLVGHEVARLVRIERV